MSKLITLSKGYSTIVDDEDYERLSEFKWYCIVSRGRHTTVVGYNKYSKKSQIMSRLIMDCPKDRVVDHINHDTMDNRRSNLRICTRTQNGQNRNKQKALSQYKGLSWNKILKKWLVRIQVNNERLYLGLFMTELGAACVYNIAARKYHGEYARLNEITGI